MVPTKLIRPIFACAFCAPLWLSTTAYTAPVLFNGLNPAQSKMVATSVHDINVNLESQAQNIINSLGDEAISLMANGSLGQQGREQAFAKLLRKHFDMKTIGRFVLGRYWRSANDVQKSEYQTLFENMVVNVYSKRFNEYSGQAFSVAGSRREGTKDVIVHSVVDSGSNNIAVDWRLRQKRDGSLKVIDVIVEGVSMSVTQRSDFSAVIQRGGGNIEVLLDHLRKQ
jgi:phospholipid transport system substrate-binding protein